MKYSELKQHLETLSPQQLNSKVTVHFSWNNDQLTVDHFEFADDEFENEPQPLLVVLGSFPLPKLKIGINYFKRLLTLNRQ